MGYATTIEISSGAARDSQNINDIILSDTVDLDLTLTRRVNGLNTGSLQATKAYKVYVIGDSYNYNPTGVVAILDQGDIDLPLGYDIYAQIGSFTTDGSAEVRKFYQYGKAGLRTFYYDEPIQVLTNGAATNSTLVDITNYVPRTLTLGDIKTARYELTAVYPGTVSDQVAVDVQNHPGNYIIFGNGSAQTAIYNFEFACEMTTAAQIAFYYIVGTGTTLSVKIVGYEDILI